MGIMDTKTCRDCGAEKPASEFYAQRGGTRKTDGLASYCKPCHRARNRAWDERNRERLQKLRQERGRHEGPARRLYGPPVPPALEKRREKLAARHGITPEDYARLLDAQGGGCAICGGGDPDRRLAVDHCHDTGLVRGLLCFSCNTGLGKLGDTADALYRAWQYVAGVA